MSRSYTSPPKRHHGDVGRVALLSLRSAADFIGLKNSSPRPGLNPRTLGPVANTLPLDRRGRQTTSEVQLSVEYSY
jgi:hypothetical protein